MPVRQDQRSRLQFKGPQGLVNIVVLMLAFGLLILQLLSHIVLAFADSYWFGARSLAAAIFPITVAIYIGFLARVQVPVNNSYAPVVNNYIILLLWTILIIGIDRSYDLLAFPLKEILYSFTLAFMLFRYKRQTSFKDLLACCYGVLSGALAAIIIFGWNPTTL